MGYIESGKSEGAVPAVEGGRADLGNGKGYFVKPSVFDRVDPRMRIAQEGIFGPSLSPLSCESVDELIEKANGTISGLAAAVWTRDIGKAHRIARSLKAGTVWINTYNNYDAAAAFGGYKMSGYGRELGMHALEHYTQVKSVWVNLKD